MSFRVVSSNYVVIRRSSLMRFKSCSIISNLESASPWLLSSIIFSSFENEINKLSNWLLAELTESITKLSILEKILSKMSSRLFVFVVIFQYLIEFQSSSIQMNNYHHFYWWRLRGRVHLCNSYDERWHTGRSKVVVIKAICLDYFGTVDIRYFTQIDFIF